MSESINLVSDVVNIICKFSHIIDIESFLLTSKYYHSLRSEIDIKNTINNKYKKYVRYPF